MSAPHTPGPWLVSRLQPHRIMTVGRAFVASLDGYRTRDIGETNANAALIAAAPDLLTAAQRMAAQLGGGNDFAEWEAAKAELLTAIAKATGKETNA